MLFGDRGTVKRALKTRGATKKENNWPVFGPAGAKERDGLIGEPAPSRGKMVRKLWKNESGGGCGFSVCLRGGGFDAHAQFADDFHLLDALRGPLDLLLGKVALAVAGQNRNRD